MAREEYIRIYRSDVGGATPSLTSGEIAANLVDGKFFIGGTNGSRITFSSDSISVTGINGLTGNVSLTGDGNALFGYGNNRIGARLGSYTLTGAASFDPRYFGIGLSGHLVLTGAYQVTGDTVQAGSFINIGAGKTINNIGVQTFNGATGVVSFTIPIAGATSGVTGTASFNPNRFQVSATGNVDLVAAYQVTGDTIVAGSAINFITSGRTKTINNIGVTSFNGATGAINFTVPIAGATSGVTGTASFNSNRFQVSATGNVDLVAAYQVTGDTVITVVGSGIGISTNGRTDTIYNIGVTGIGFGADVGLTGKINLTAGNNITITQSGNTITIGGIAQQITAVTGDGAAIIGRENAYITARLTTAAGATGIASFRNTHFLVDGTGHVQLAAAYQVTGDTIVAGSAINFSTSGTTKTLNNIGVTSFNGATGAINFTVPIAGATSGVTGTASFNPNRFQVSITGNVDLVAAYQVTGDTIVAGSAINFITSGRTKTLNNIGVTSFNGATGTINFTVPIAGATSGVTGTASFNANRFQVSITGNVDLLAAYQATGDTVQAGSFINIGTGKIINNIGVQTFNGATGAVTFTVPIAGATSGVTGTASFNRNRFQVSITGNVDLIAAYQATGDTVQAGSFINIGTGKTINNIGVQTFNGATGSVSLTGDGNALQGKANNLLTVRMVTDNAVTGVASFDATHFTVATTGHVRSKGVMTINSQAPDANGNFTVAAATVVTGDGGAIEGKSDAFITARLGSYTLTGVASFDPQFFGIGTSGHLVLTGAYQATGDTVITVAGSGIGIVTNGRTDTLYNIGVTGVTTASISYGQTGVNGIFLSGTTGNISIQNTGVRALTVQGSEITTPSWYQKGPQLRSTSGISIGAGYDNIFTFEGPYLQISNTGLISFNGVLGEENPFPSMTGDGGAVYGYENNGIGARLGSYTLTGVASYDPRFFGIGLSGHLVLTGAYQVTGDTVQAGSFINIGAGKTINNIGVQTFNGATGTINFTVPIAGATSGVTGTASFNRNRFQVSITGNVDLLAAYQATGDTVQAGSFINIGAGKTINNIGVQTFNGATGTINFTVPIAGATSGVTGTASFNRNRFQVSLTGNVDLLAAYQATGDTVQAGSFINIGAGKTINNIGVQSFNGLTGARTLTGDDQAIIGRGNNAITARVVTECGITGVLGIGCGSGIIVDPNTGLISGIDSGNPCSSCSSLGEVDCVNNGSCTWCSQNSSCICGGQNCGINPGGVGGLINAFSGIGISSGTGGQINGLYFDAGSLTFNSAITLDPKNDFVVFYDASHTGLIKTKRIQAERVILDNDAIFNSKSSQFVKSKSSSNIEFEVLTAVVTPGEEKLLKSGDAYTYITQNTVKSLNGQTGDVAVVGSLNGCTGTITITGTVNEVVVTNSCPTITIGLPDNVSIPYLSGTGATFTQTVTATRFIGIVSGGDF